VHNTCSLDCNRLSYSKENNQVNECKHFIIVYISIAIFSEFGLRAQILPLEVTNVDAVREKGGVLYPLFFRVTPIFQAAATFKAFYITSTCEESV